MAEIYECGICSCYHSVLWNGDCREDDQRFTGPEDFAEREGLSIYDVDVVEMPGCCEDDEGEDEDPDNWGDVFY